MEREWLSPTFYRKLADWKATALQAASRPTHLAEIARREIIRLEFCDALGLGAVGVWLYPAMTGHNLVWHNTWPPEITTDLVFSTNPQGTITNSYPKLTTLVL